MHTHPKIMNTINTAMHKTHSFILNFINVNLMTSRRDSRRELYFLLPLSLSSDALSESYTVDT